MPLPAAPHVLKKIRATHMPLAAWVFLVAVAVRLFVLIHLAASPYLVPESGDMRFYSDWALRIGNGEFTDGHAFYGLPGYAFFLAAIYWAADLGLFLTSAFHSIPLGQPHPIAVGLLQAMSEGFIAVIILTTAQAVFATHDAADETDHLSCWRGDIVGCIAALGWILFQPAQSFATVLMPTTWLVLAYWGCVWWLLNVRTSSAWRPWLWIGILMGAVAMMIATVLFLIPLAAVAIWLNVARNRPPAQRLPRLAGAFGCIVAGLFIGASPCWLHNFFVAKEPVFLSAHGGVNFYIGNNALANGYPKVPPGMRAGQEGMLKDSIAMAEAAEGRPLTRAEVSRHWSAEADKYIRAHFIDWLKLMGLKLKNFWNAYQYDDLSLITLFAEDGIITPGIRFGLVAALAIPGMVFAGVKYPRSRWVIAAIFLHMAALMPVFVTERYRLAAVPGLLLMAGIGLWELWNNLATAKWTRSLAWCAAASAMAWFVAWPPQGDNVWSLDYYNTGIEAERAGDLVRAQKNLEIAYAYVPENSEINFALGNLWLEKGDRGRAKEFYRAAIRINARHSSAFNNLGVLAMDEQRWELAGRFFTASLQIEPDDARTWYQLARVRKKLNDLPGAREAIERALKLKPGQPQFQRLSAQLREK
jgi:tetratricopeptide (TPR) repeat protein